MGGGHGAGRTAPNKGKFGSVFFVTHLAMSKTNAGRNMGIQNGQNSLHLLILLLLLLYSMAPLPP